MADEATQAALLRTIVGMFGAAPSGSIFESLLATIDGGTTLADLARTFGDSAVFRDPLLYPDALDDAAFAESFLRNLLALPADFDFSAATAAPEFQAARQWLIDRVAADGRGAAAYEAVSALATLDHPLFADAKARLEHRVEVAEYFVARHGEASTLAALQAVVSAVDGGGDSVAGALAAIDLDQGPVADPGFVYPGRFDVAGALSGAAALAEIPVTLVAGRTYVLQATAAQASSLDPAIAAVLGPDGQPVAGWANDDFFANAAQLTLSPSITGTYTVRVSAEDGSAGAFAASLRDVTATGTSRARDLALGVQATGMVDVPFGRQEFALELAAGQQVTVRLESLAGAANPLARPKIFEVRDPEGARLDGSAAIAADAFGAATLTLTAGEAGTYKLRVGDAYNDLGAFALTAATATTRGAAGARSDDAPADASTSLSVAVGASASGVLETGGDRDWLAMELTAGTTYRLTVSGVDGGGGTLGDPVIEGVYDASGRVLDDTFNDDSDFTTYDSAIEFTAPSSGRHAVEVGGYGSAAGSYTVALSALASGADVAADATSTAMLDATGAYQGLIEQGGDEDWIGADLAAGTAYRISLRGADSAAGTLSDPVIRGIADAAGNMLPDTFDDDGGDGLDSRLAFTAPADGRYFVVAGGYGQARGSYRLDVVPSADDAPSDGTTALTLAAGGTTAGQFEDSGDEDWVAADLRAGHHYVLDLSTSSAASWWWGAGNILGVYDLGATATTLGVHHAFGPGDDRLLFSPSADGRYFFALYGSAEAAWTAELSEVSDDAPTTPGTTLTVTGSVPAAGSFDYVGDADWIAADLSAGTGYDLALAGGSYGQVDTILDASGSEVTWDVAYGWVADTPHAYFTPTAGGRYYVQVSGDGGRYTLTLAQPAADEPASVATPLQIAVGGTLTSSIGVPGDRDWVSADLLAGRRYQIDLRGTDSGGGTLSDPYFGGVHTADGSEVPNTEDDDSGHGLDAHLFFTPAAEGRYFLEAGAYGSGTGTYTVTVVEAASAANAPQTSGADVGASDATAGALAVGAPVASEIDMPSDIDWFRVSLAAGHLYEFAMEGAPTAMGSLADPLIEGIYDFDGNLVAGSGDDDSGFGLNALANFVPTETGDYFVAARGYGRETGGYTLSVADQGMLDASVAPPLVPSATAGSWTVMVYIAADNDLEEFALTDLNEMEAASLPGSVCVVAGIDRTPGYDDSEGNWSDARVALVGQDSSPGRLTSPFYSAGEVNTGDGTTLRAFIDWATALRPADHYALVIWDHGGGIDGVAIDESSGSDRLTLAEVREAIAGTQVGRLDVVGFDACLQGMVEQAHALGGVADWLLASQDLEPGEGWNYTTWLGNAFAGGGSPTPQGVSRAAVASYEDEYSYDSTVTLSATDLSALSGLTTALQGFVQAAGGAGAADWSAIAQARDRVPAFADSDGVDIGAFAARLAGVGGISPGLAGAAQAVAVAVDAAVLAETANQPGTTGLAIYWPESRPYDFAAGYAEDVISLVGATGWGSFLESYWAHA